jgi:hypothetical protein
MNALSTFNKYRIRILENVALRLKYPDGNGHAGVIRTKDSVEITINRALGWMFVLDVPGRVNAGMPLSQLHEHWDDLVLEIDVYRVNTSWTQVKEWNEVEFPECITR